jgi:hypothetical protein
MNLSRAFAELKRRRSTSPSWHRRPANARDTSWSRPAHRAGERGVYSASTRQ